MGDEISIWRSEDEFKDTEIGRIPKEWEVMKTIRWRPTSGGADCDSK